MNTTLLTNTKIDWLKKHCNPNADRSYARVVGFDNQHLIYTDGFGLLLVDNDVIGLTTDKHAEAIGDCQFKYPNVSNVKPDQTTMQSIGNTELYKIQLFLKSVKIKTDTFIFDIRSLSFSYKENPNNGINLNLLQKFLKHFSNQWMLSAVMYNNDGYLFIINDRKNKLQNVRLWLLKVSEQG